MDERFINAWEHCEHTYRAIKEGLHPPWWWFADLANSDQYIQELASSEVNSVIRKTDAWHRNMQEGTAWFKVKHGFTPTAIPDTHPDVVIKKLEEIQANYARKVL